MRYPQLLFFDRRSRLDNRSVCFYTLIVSLYKTVRRLLRRRRKERRCSMGKNFIVGQSGGPTAVINASLAGVAAAALEAIRAAGSDAVVYGMQHGIQGFARGEVVDLGAQLTTEADIALLKTTPAAALGSCRRRLPAAADEPQVYEDIFRRLAELDIGYFFYIGGNDSMDTIQKLHDWGAAHGSDIRFVGVPKTIDNDLAMTDHTPGYGSAARYIATVMKELLCDSLVYDEKRVTVVEIMGRNAGWLAGAAALSADEECAGPDLCICPRPPLMWRISSAVWMRCSKSARAWWWPSPRASVWTTAAMCAS